MRNKILRFIERHGGVFYHLNFFTFWTLCIFTPWYCTLCYFLFFSCVLISMSEMNQQSRSENIKKDYELTNYEKWYEE